MPYIFVADSFYTKKLCSRLSKCDFRRKTALLRFWVPLWGAYKQRTMITSDSLESA